MSEAPEKSTGGRLRNRRRRTDDDDENEEQEQQLEQQKVTRRKAPKAMDAAPDTQPSTHADPVAMGAPAVPPSSVATATAAAAAGGDSGAGAAVAGLQGATGAAEDIFEIAYDSYTSEDLYALLKRHTRQEVEKRMAEHEQLRRKQQQAPQVERFLDATVTARTGGSSSSGGTAEEMGGYKYSVMLQRLFVALNRNKESSAMSERNQLPVPQLEKIGKKKVIITNFGRICQAFHRPIEDVKDYIEKELSVGGNLDSNDALILKYEIQKATAFDKILIRYLDEYVKCNSCHKIDTTLTKEGRRMELRCNWCTATRSVQAVGSATYSAQVGKRSKVRLQALTL
ncbi:translation initiation factor [Trypanosoma grayi]|uniref:translation initiation factor n=1 Tax=Trypanosoma grayi TaxID=71804 RepID=UPI0004F4A80D|nr:translation initiation factor [Trypanosoma grayi]KEG11575.1 translation initiation factor [Trypanosoma grayi]